MPMSRYQIRNEYSLADPELYGVADKDDPEALLEAVAMAGLVGVLRQLGDLAEFAAEVFHDLHEEVMATATRGHGLMVRVKQLEAEFPLIEKAFLTQTSPSPFFSSTGTDWHPSLHRNQNLITGGDLPRFIMDSYEECRGPPRLFLLDKFDVAGAGACLKRYTDPSFFKVEASSYGPSSAEVQKGKRSRKSKKKGSRLRNAGTPEVLPTSHAKLQQLFLEDRVENGVTDPARLVKLKRKLNGNPFDSKTGKSFMEKFINTSSPEDKVVHEIAYGSSLLELPSKTTSESGAAVSSLKETMIVEGIVLKPFVDEVSEDLSDGEYSSRTNQYPLKVVDEKEIAVNGKSKTDGNEGGYQSDGVASEVENYVDALATMESEIETDTEFRTKYDIGFVDIEKQGTSYDANEELFQVQFSDSQSTGNTNASEEGNILVEKGSSSFSYSDTGSTAAEIMPVDVDVAAKVSTSTKVCEAEVAVTSTEKVSTSDELSVSQDYHQPPKLDVSDDTSNEVNDMPSHGSESGESSSSLRHSDSFPTHIPLDEGEILARGTLRGPQMVKILSNHDELDTKFIKTEVNRITWGNNIPWTSRHPSIPSHTKDDEPPTDIASAENHILDKLDGDPGLLSSAPIHISENILEVNPKKYDDESSLDDLLEAEHEEDRCTENLVDSQISQSQSVISHAEVNPSVLALLNSETTNTVLQPEVLGSVDNIFPSAKATTFDSNFVSDSLSNSSIAEQQGAEWADEVPQIPIGSAVVSCHEEEIPNGFLPEANSGEKGEITRSISLIESEATGVEKNSDYLNSVGPRSFTGFPVPSKADDVKEGEISSSMNLDGIEATALVISSGSLKTTGPGLLIDEKQTEVDQSENITMAAIVANHDSDADKVDSTSKRNFPAEDSHRVQKPDQYGSEVYDEFLPQNYNESVKQTAMVNQEIASPDLDSVQCEIAFADHSDSDKATEMSLQPVKATALSFSSIYNVQNTEPVSSVESNFHVYSGDTLPTSTHHFPEVRTHSEPKLTIQTDQLDIEHLHVDESKPTEVSQSEQLRTHSEPKLTIQTDQLDIEHLHVDESKPTEVSMSEQLRCLDHLDEGSIDAQSEPCFVASKPVVQANIQADILAAESLYGDKASFGSSSKFVVNQMDHGGNVITSPRSSSVPPLLDLSQPVSHEVDISPQAGDELSAVRSSIPLLPEVPQIDLADLPPLPPLPPVQWRIGRAQQHSSQPSDRDSVNTFGLFPPMFPSKTSNNTQMGYPTNKDDLLPPVPVLPPPAVKDEDLQHVYEHFLDSTAHTGPLSMQIPLTSNNRSRNVPTSESTSNTDPCLTLSHTGNEIPGHGMRAGEAGSMQSSFTPSSTVITSVDTSFLTGSVPSHPFTQMQPEVCLEPETTSIRLEVRLIKFPDTNVPQPTVADEHPKDVSTTSDGEAVWSTSNSLYPALEDGTLNGNRQMKLPRPRSPLIDAVAAHNKSMLRKVTERSRPEVQKVEERDSLLEQIRAKSFNLKPAVVTRPSIQGPKTNLRVAAILEKANAIRQALAGSDEDDDDDSWSDE